MNTRKQILVDRWKLRLSQELDTLNLQIDALSYFLGDIGYSLEWYYSHMHIVKKSEGGVKDDNPQFMKLDLAVALYNGTPMKTNGTICEVLDFTFHRGDFKKAHNNRILCSVYLQRSQGKIKVQKNWVKFNNPVNIGMEHK